MKVLFVCTGNSYRSPVAEALLKKLRSDVEVDSAGTDPAKSIALSGKNFLKKENAVQNLKTQPENIEQKSVEKYDLIVVMGENNKKKMLQKWPHLKEKIKFWDIADPYYLPQGFKKKIFEQIEHKVAELSKNL